MWNILRTIITRNEFRNSKSMHEKFLNNMQQFINLKKSNKPKFESLILLYPPLDFIILYLFFMFYISYHILLSYFRYHISLIHSIGLK